jgi:hypothetical protein
VTPYDLLFLGVQSRPSRGRLIYVNQLADNIEVKAR